MSALAATLAGCDRSAGVPAADTPLNADVTALGVSSANGHARPEWLYSASPTESCFQRFDLLKPKHEFGGSIGTCPWGVAVDRRHDVYVVTDNEVEVFDAKMDEPPKRSFTFDSNYQGYSLAVDGRGQVYVEVVNGTTFTGSVQVFAAGASGQVSPVREIVGASTQIAEEATVNLDTDGTLYVGSRYEILVFPRNANGNVTPARMITGVPFINQVTLGADGNLYAATTSGGFLGEVVVIPKTTNGPAQPLWTLEAGHYGSSIALGPSGIMYLGPQKISSHIAVFAPGASGKAKPIGFVGKDIGFPHELALGDPWLQP